MNASSYFFIAGILLCIGGYYVVVGLVFFLMFLSMGDE